MNDIESILPLVSVIIPSHNRSLQLINCLIVLNNQTFDFKNFEVIVVADACTDNTIAEIEKFKNTAKYSLQVLEHTLRRASCSRNKGIKHAKGSILLFLDDDVLPAFNFIEKHVEFQKNYDVVIGYLETIIPEKPDLWHLIARIWWENRFEEMNKPGHLFSYKDLFTGNVSIKTSLINSVGIFNENFKRLEDYELGYRLIKTSAKFSFSMDAKGSHHETNTLKQWAIRIIDESNADVNMGNLYPELRKDIFKERNEFSLLKKLVFVNLFPVKVLVYFLLAMSKFFNIIKARNLWRICIGFVSQINYWRGVKNNFKSYSDFEEWVSAGISSNFFSYDTYSIDRIKDSGNNLLKKDIDKINRNGLKIRYDNIDIFSYKYIPGFELLHEEKVKYIKNQPIHQVELENISLKEKLFGKEYSKPIKIIDIDIADSIPSVNVESNFDYLMINIFLKNHPVGKLLLKSNNKRKFSQEELYSVIQKNFNDQLQTHLLAEVLGKTNKTDFPQPSISIFISAFYENNLIKCLESVKNINYPNFEVIVIDSFDREDSLINEILEFGFKYKKIVKNDLHKWNESVKQSSSEIIVFINDNAVVPYSWLNKIAKAFSDKNTFVVKGLVLPDKLETDSELDFEFYIGSYKLFLPFNITIYKWNYCRRFIKSIWERENNVAFRRNIIEAKIRREKILSDKYIFKYEPNIFLKSKYKKETLLNELIKNRKSYFYYLSVVKSIMPYLKKHNFFTSFLLWIINWQGRKIIRSLIKMDIKNLFYTISEVKEFLVFFYIYKNQHN